jgi:FkbM family methyltransferase
MALSDAVENIARNYRFHRGVRGGRFKRLAYLTAYFGIFVLFRRGDRHLRALNWLRASGLSDLMVDVEAEGLRLRMDLHTAFDPLFAVFGERGYEQVEGFRPLPGWTVLDVGANVGLFAARAAKLAGPEGRVLAVEPHPGNFALLSENGARNGLSRLLPVRAAMDEKPGHARLFLHERAINHSLVRESERWLDVEVKTIDGLAKERGLERLDLIKIDTEGNVPQILRGGRETIARLRPRIVFEQDSPEESAGADELLAGLGYETRKLVAYTFAWPR